jgi:hypothetical protein
MLSDNSAKLPLSAIFLNIRKWLERAAKLSKQDNSTVFFVILAIALLVIVLRVLAPFDAYWDQGIQLESAHRLANGWGLTSTYSAKVVSNDLNQVPEPQHLTWFPPGFSVLIGALLALGLPAILALKLVYSLVTLVGWIGWGLIAALMLAKPLRLFTKSIPVQYAIAAILPVFFTPDWGGTDIFLWAGVPWIILLISQTISTGKPGFLMGAGLIVGLLYAFRYASLFLALSVLMILAIAYLPRIKLLIGHYAIFLAASLVFMLPVSIYLRIVQGGTGLPTYVSNQGLAAFSATLDRIIQQLPTASTLFGLPIREILAGLPPHTLGRSLYGIGTFLILAGLPVWARRSKTELSREFGILLGVSCLPISLVLFLIICMFTNPFGFLETERYYVAANLCFILAIYRLATFSNTNWGIRFITSLFVLTLIVHYGLYRPTELWSGKQGKFIQQVTGYMPTPDVSYPSNELYSSNVSESLEVTIKKLKQENPEAIFFVMAHPFYVYDGSTGFRIIPPADFWKDAYVTKPTRVFWVTSYVCYGLCSTHVQKNIEEISKLPQLKKVFEDPEGKGTIFSADLPAGFKFGPNLVK